MRKVVGVSSVMAFLVLVVAGCAKPPTVEIDAAMAAMAEATKAEAEVYAPEAMQAARSAQAAFEEEVKLQEGKFALFRKYDKAKTMVAEATAAAGTAATQAAENKNRIRQEVTTMIGETPPSSAVIGFLSFGRSSRLRRAVAAAPAPVDGPHTIVSNVEVAPVMCTWAMPP